MGHRRQRHPTVVSRSRRLIFALALCGCQRGEDRVVVVRGADNEIAATSERIVIDGELAEPDWNRRGHPRSFVSAGELARPYSQVRLLHDATTLYIGLYAADQDVRSTDHFDISIGALQLAVNPNGVVTPTVFGVRAAHDLDGTLDDSHDEDEEWLIELAIPLAQTELAIGGRPVNFRAARCDTPKDGNTRCAEWASALTLDGPAPPFVARPGDLAITDVTVVPMSPNREAGELAHQTVIVRGERIASLSPTASTKLPAGITAIDGRGKWLMPGLADMHVHTWRDDDLTMFLAAGVTTIRNMWGSPQQLMWRSQIAYGERLGPTIVTAGNLIDGDPPDWAGSTVLTNPADAEGIVATQQADGYDFVKSVNQLSREAYVALVAAVKRHGMTLVGHVPFAVGVDGALAAGQRSIEHLDGYLAALVPPGTALPPIDASEARDRAVLAKLDLGRLPGLIERTRAAGTWNCPTLVALDHIGSLDDTAGLRERTTWLDAVPAAITARWGPIDGFAAEDYATVRAGNARLRELLAALVASGAPILVGTDTGVSFVVPGEALHEEIELMVAAGIPRARVMHAATADAWQFLGSPHEAGVVEPGARADLVLTSIDPLTAPLALVPDGVIVRGTWLPHDELEAKLADIVRREAHVAPSLPPLAHESGHYLTTLDGTLVGEERIAVSDATIVGTVADLSEAMQATYDIAPDRASVTARYHGVTLHATASVAGGAVDVRGNDLSGRPIAIHQSALASALLVVRGVGASIAIARGLDGMPVGGKRVVTALELGYFPAVELASARYAIERKPDRAGQRVFAIAATRSGSTVTSELVIAASGELIGETTGREVIALTRR